MARQRASNLFQPFPSQHLIKAKVRRMPETTKYFSSFRPQFSSTLTPLGKDTNRCLNRTQNTVLFYLFCKFHLSNLAYKT